MNVRQKVRGSVIGFIGFMLSPLSWWNDLVVNFPLAIAFGWVISLIYAPAFETSVVIGYWLTNVLGLILLRRGARDVFTAEPAAVVRKELFKDLLISLLYTALIVALVKWKFVEPLPHYLSQGGPK